MRWIRAVLAFAVFASTVTLAVPASSVEVDSTYVEGTDRQAFLFNPLEVNRIDLTMTPADETSLRNDPRTYYPATLKLTTSLGATANYQVGVHIKGGWGSYRSLDEKTGFKIKVDYSVKGQTVFGLKKITLNNMVQDASMLHEAVSYRLFRAMRVAAPRVGYANVYFNGINYGLHSNIETYDKPMLSRWFPNGTDHLLEGAYGVEVGPGMEVDEGSATELADVTELRDLNNSLSGKAWFDAIQARVDLNEMIMNWAVEHYIMHWDGYTRGWPNNYYIHKARGGLFTMHPWGTDQTWVWWNPLVDDGATMMTRCIQYEPCHQLYQTALGEILIKLPSLALPNMVDKIWTKISASVNSDPRKPYSYQDSINSKNSTKAVMNSRYQELLSSNGVRNSSALTVGYPLNGYTVGGTIRPKLTMTGDGTMSYWRVEGFGVCVVDPISGAVVIQNSGICRIAAQISQTANFHSSMKIVRLSIPKLASRISVARYSSLQIGRSITFRTITDSIGTVTMKLKSGRCRVSGKTVRALASSGKCIIQVSVAGDDNYLKATKYYSITLRR